MQNRASIKSRLDPVKGGLGKRQSVSYSLKLNCVEAANARTRGGRIIEGLSTGNSRIARAYCSNKWHRSVDRVIKNFYRNSVEKPAGPLNVSVIASVDKALRAEKWSSWKTSKPSDCAKSTSRMVREWTSKAGKISGNMTGTKTSTSNWKVANFRPARLCDPQILLHRGSCLWSMLHPRSGCRELEYLPA